MKNWPIEYFRLIAAFAVIFIHVALPGRIGSIANCLARFAVPFFLMVSGYFCYQTGGDRIARRMLHIGRMNIAATLVYMAWGCFETRYINGQGRLTYLLNSLSVEKIARWFVLNDNPFSDHLWYLTALFFCYLIMWLYVRFQGERNINYQPLYIVSVCLFGVQIALGPCASAVGMNLSNEIYRNALFLGLPMFSLGLFVRQYQEQIIANLHLTVPKLVLIAACGALLSILQWFGIGQDEMPIGTVVGVIALMLILVSNPGIKTRSAIAEKIVGKFGPISAFIYIMHPLWQKIYNACCQESMIAALGGLEGYLKPFIILAVSLVTGVVYACVLDVLKRVRKI